MSGLPPPVGALALTIAAEFAVYWAALLNALTEPPATLLYYRVGHPWAVEGGVWLVEGALLARLVPLPPARALLLSGTSSLAGRQLTKSTRAGPPRAAAAPGARTRTTSSTRGRWPSSSGARRRDCRR